MSILRYNRKSDFYAHFNHMRSYVLNDESALVMASRRLTPTQKPASLLPATPVTALLIGKTMAGMRATDVSAAVAVDDRGG